MNTNQKSMRYDQNDYDALLHSKIPAALVETPQMNLDDASDASVFFARELDYSFLLFNAFVLYVPAS